MRGTRIVTGVGEPTDPRGGRSAEKTEQVFSESGDGARSEHLGVGIPMEVLCDKACSVGTCHRAVRRPARESGKIVEAQPAGADGPGVALKNAAMSGVRTLRTGKLQ